MKQNITYYLSATTGIILVTASLITSAILLLLLSGICSALLGVESGSHHFAHGISKIINDLRGL
jgi:hypothetical protein